MLVLALCCGGREQQVVHARCGGWWHPIRRRIVVTSGLGYLLNLMSSLLEDRRGDTKSSSASSASTLRVMRKRVQHICNGRVPMAGGQQLKFAHPLWFFHSQRPVAAPTAPTNAGHPPSVRTQPQRTARPTYPARATECKGWGSSVTLRGPSPSKGRTTGCVLCLCVQVRLGRRSPRIELVPSPRAAVAGEGPDRVEGESSPGLNEFWERKGSISPSLPLAGFLGPRPVHGFSPAIALGMGPWN